MTWFLILVCSAVEVLHQCCVFVAMKLFLFFFVHQLYSIQPLFVRRRRFDGCRFFLCVSNSRHQLCLHLHWRPLGESGTAPAQRLLSQRAQTEGESKCTETTSLCFFLDKLDMNKLRLCSLLHQMRTLTEEPSRPVQTVIFSVLWGCLYLSKKELMLL